MIWAYLVGFLNVAFSLPEKQFRCFTWLAKFQFQFASDLIFKIMFEMFSDFKSHCIPADNDCFWIAKDILWIWYIDWFIDVVIWNLVSRYRWFKLIKFSNILCLKFLKYLFSDMQQGRSNLLMRVRRSLTLLVFTEVMDWAYRPRPNLRIGISELSLRNSILGLTVKWHIDSSRCWHHNSIFAMKCLSLRVFCSFSQAESRKTWFMDIYVDPFCKRNY